MVNSTVPEGPIQLNADVAGYGVSGLVYPTLLLDFDTDDTSFGIVYVVGSDDHSRSHLRLLIRLFAKGQFERGR